MEGFAGIGERMRQQDEQVVQFARQAQELLTTLEAVSIRASKSRDRLDRLAGNQVRLSQRQLGVAAKVEAVIARGKPENAAEQELRRRLDGLLEQLRRSSNVSARLDELHLAIQQREEAAVMASGTGAGGAADTGGGAGGDIKDAADLRAVYRQLEQHRRAIEQLQALLARDERDVRLASDEIEKLDAARRAAASGGFGGGGGYSGGYGGAGGAGGGYGYIRTDGLS
jgi:hypothetical protein